MTATEFNNIKKGDAFCVTFDSAVRTNTNRILIARGKPRSLKGGLLHRAIFDVQSNPNGVKYYMYLRNGKVTLAKGDLALYDVKIEKA